MKIEIINLNNEYGNGAAMLKKIRTNLKAAVMLIATENLSALRVLRKNIANLISKSVHLHRKL